MKQRIGLCLVILLAGLGSRAAQGANELSVASTPSNITVGGITRGGDVAFFGVGLEPRRHQTIVHRWSSVVSDTAKAGTVIYSPEAAVTWNAVWVVADLTSGRYAIVSTPGYPLMRSRIERHELKRDTAAAVNRFLFSRSEADFLYIAPGGGAWKMSVRDGDVTDSDTTADGNVALDLSRIEPLAGVERPRAFTPGGTLIAIDPARLEVLEVKIDGSMLGGAK